MYRDKDSRQEEKTQLTTLVSHRQRQQVETEYETNNINLCNRQHTHTMRWRTSAVYTQREVINGQKQPTKIIQGRGEDETREKGISRTYIAIGGTHQHNFHH